jgi:uncharacterized Zn-finger protein
MEINSKEFNIDEFLLYNDLRKEQVSDEDITFLTIINYCLQESSLNMMKEARSGICYVVNSNHKINLNEKSLFKQFIKKCLSNKRFNKLKNAKSGKIVSLDLYWWKRGKLKPRIKHLNEVAQTILQKYK